MQADKLTVFLFPVRYEFCKAFKAVYLLRGDKLLCIVGWLQGGSVGYFFRCFPLTISKSNLPFRSLTFAIISMTSFFTLTAAW